MRPLLLILALLLSQVGCAQPMSTRRFSVDERPPAVQRNGRTNEVNRDGAESGPRAVLADEARGTSRPAPSEGESPTAPIGTAGRRESEAVTEGSGTTAAVGSGEVESKDDADAPISYSVGVAQPGSNRGRVAAAVALGAAVVAVALWAVRRRLAP